jgi:hypothetical protein
VNTKKEIRNFVKQTLQEVITFAGGGGWDSNNDISHFHGFPSGYSRFPFLDSYTPEMMPDSEELNSDKENIFDSEEFKQAMDDEIQNCLKNKQFIDPHKIAKKILSDLGKLESWSENEND